GRHDQVPLPVDVGELLVAYLRGGRPASVHRQVFLGVDASHQILGAAAVSCVAARALERAGVAGPGAAHRLRHTAASGVLAGGGGLIEAGQLLRHSSPQATAVYVQVRCQGPGRAGPPLADQGDPMSVDLRAAAADYLSGRRARGYRLECHDSLIAGFLDGLEARAVSVISVADAVLFAHATPAARRRRHAERLHVIRGLAAFVHALDPAAAELIPDPLIAGPVTRTIPYLYTPEQTVQLMDRAALLRPEPFAAAIRTLIGVVAATGLRSGEALGLASTISTATGGCCGWSASTASSGSFPHTPAPSTRWMNICACGPRPRPRRRAPCSSVPAVDDSTRSPPIPCSGPWSTTATSSPGRDVRPRGCMTSDIRLLSTASSTPTAKAAMSMPASPCWPPTSVTSTRPTRIGI
ncbi:MAG: hypothetical protein M3N98_08315, partial [Actinomycetota bacterium]|nr:hypothetical protein [Actinomycetota bacterium]